MRKSIKKVSLVLMLLTVFALSLAACGGGGGNNDSIDGTWVPAAGEVGAFQSITFDGSNVSIPIITIMSDTPGTGMRTTFRIANDELILTQSGHGVSQEIGRFDFRRDGGSIFINDVEYVRE